MAVFDDYQQVFERHKTNDLSESQPTKGNIVGGLTTIEEKAFGNVEKLGKKTKFVCLKSGGSTGGQGAVVHGHFKCRSRSCDTMGGLRRGCAFVPHRPG